MQTFLPDPDFHRCAEVLDWRRLGKQRVECKQILEALSKKRQGIKAGWQNHPAVRMWEGYDYALSHYMAVIIREWVRRGYKNNMDIPSVEQPIELPPWIGDERIHSSHRARLLDKNPDHYSQFGWTDKPRTTEEGYYWPI